MRSFIAFANQYFKRDITIDDVVWSFSGVRPLNDDGTKIATAATRGYTLNVDTDGGAPILDIFGGKIITYRRLAQSALSKISLYFDDIRADWTAGAPLLGGGFPADGVATLIAELQQSHPFLDDRWAKRLVRACSSEARDVIAHANSVVDLGQDFGATLTEAEVIWLMDHGSWIMNLPVAAKISCGAAISLAFV
jgi:glycerol-3-phosphate dehydrogenase